MYALALHVLGVLIPILIIFFLSFYKSVVCLQFSHSMTICHVFFLKKNQFLFFWFLIFFLDFFVKVLLVFNFIILSFFMVYILFSRLTLVLLICFSLCWDIFTFQLNPPVYFIISPIIWFSPLLFLLQFFCCRSFRVINSFSYLVIKCLICWELNFTIFIFILLSI
jgi:hypothetical protein